jgi:hypothetical protein
MRAISFLTVLFAAALATATARADDYTLGALRIEAPWARPSAGMARTGAAYLTIVNRGGAADRLIAAASPAAGRVELHESRMDNGVMRMRPVVGIEVAPGASVQLRPGGLHIMLIDLKKPLEEGGEVRLKLTFEKAGTIEIEAEVRRAPAEPGHGMHSGGQHGKPGN